MKTKIVRSEKVKELRGQGVGCEVTMSANKRNNREKGSEPRAETVHELTGDDAGYLTCISESPLSETGVNQSLPQTCSSPGQMHHHPDPETWLSLGFLSLTGPHTRSNLQITLNPSRKHFLTPAASFHAHCTHPRLGPGCFSFRLLVSGSEQVALPWFHCIVARDTAD